MSACFSGLKTNVTSCGLQHNMSMPQHDIETFCELQLAYFFKDDMLGSCFLLTLSMPNHLKLPNVTIPSYISSLLQFQEIPQ